MRKQCAYVQIKPESFAVCSALDKTVRPVLQPSEITDELAICEQPENRKQRSFSRALFRRFLDCDEKLNGFYRVLKTLKLYL